MQDISYNCLDIQSFGCKYHVHIHINTIQPMLQLVILISYQQNCQMSICQIGQIEIWVLSSPAVLLPWHENSCTQTSLLFFKLRVNTRYWLLWKEKMPFFLTLSWSNLKKWTKCHLITNWEHPINLYFKITKKWFY